jgi:hypothetical protein
MTFGCSQYIPQSSIQSSKMACIGEFHYIRCSIYFRPLHLYRETREGWSKANVDLCSTNKRDPSLVVSLGSQCLYSVKFCFPPCTLFQFMCPHRSATWVCSRAGPPVSLYVSLVLYYCSPCTQSFPHNGIDE